MRFFVIFFLCFFLSNALSAQSKRDSLMLIWNNTSAEDSIRLSAAHELVWRVHLYNAPDSARHFAEAQLILAQKIGQLKLISSAYNNIGVTYHIQGDLKNAAIYYQHSLEADEERVRATKGDLSAIEGIASSHTNLAILYQQIGDMPLAMSSYYGGLRVLDSLEQLGGSVNVKIADVQNNIGLAQETQGATDDALLWYNRALERYEKENPGNALGNVLANIGNAINRLSKAAVNVSIRDSLAKESLAFYTRSLKVRQEIGDRRGEANALNNIASYFQQQGFWSQQEEERVKLYKDAEKYYLQSIQIAEEVKDQVGEAYSLANLAENLLRQNRIAEAIKYAESALELGRETENIEAIMRASEKLYSAYRMVKRDSEALIMHELYTQMTDSIRNEENTRLLMRNQYDYEFSKREALLVAEQDKKDAIAEVEIKRKNLQRNAFIAGFGMMMLLAIVFFSQRTRISREKERSENLLLNILPAETAQELKEKGSSEAKLIENVTVLFTDFKGFTAMSEMLSPKALVKDLHECFSEFDRICEKYGIEKIKTIGDAYMAAGGLPKANDSHAKDAVNAALEMADFVNAGKAMKMAANQPFFEIRIGVHTGPVVAGIVGIKKFQYDIWGDTVNTASRMESSGEVGRVNISQSTYELVKNDSNFSFERRGMIKAKGKGEMEMLFVSAKK